MEITRDEFKIYEEVRQDGFVNMDDILEIVEETGLDESIVREIKRRYSELAENFVDVVEEVREETESSLYDDDFCDLEGDEFDDNFSEDDF